MDLSFFNSCSKRVVTVGKLFTSGEREDAQLHKFTGVIGTNSSNRPKADLLIRNRRYVDHLSDIKPDRPAATYPCSQSYKLS